MNSLYVDIAFGLFALFLIFQGWRAGFVRMAGSLIALAVSASVATWGISWIESATGWHIATNPITFVIVFLILTLILTKLMGIMIGLLDLVRKILSIIPFVGLLNSLLGALIGLVECGLVIAAIAFATVNFFPSGELKTMLVESHAISTAVNYLVDWGIL